MSIGARHRHVERMGLVSFQSRTGAEWIAFPLILPYLMGMNEKGVHLIYSASDGSILSIQTASRLKSYCSADIHKIKIQI
mmetsp:Transcript_14786/g.39601  ORF Transcript_14786/g.39601 Transcript_14786/m.39601 type:complete len:80 (-) Transcript_14786:46-285(-)